MALKGFLGLTGFYRRFIKHHASIATPFIDLLRHNAFSWNTRAFEAFTQLKTKITEALVLSLPDFTKLFTIETDASMMAVGAIICQDNHMLAFFCKKMSPQMCVAFACIREMYVVTNAIKMVLIFDMEEISNFHRQEKFKEFVVTNNLDPRSTKIDL